MPLSVPPASPTDASTDPLYRWARVGLWLSLLVSLWIVVVLAKKSPALALLVPGAMIGAFGLMWLFKRPLLNLAALITLFAASAGYEPGVQLEEVFFAGHYVLYAGHWLFTRLFVRKETILRDASDWCVALFLVYMVGSLGLTILYGGQLTGALNEAFNFSLLSFYFPIREVVEREEKGSQFVFVLVVVLSLFASLRNLMVFQAILSDATYAWQVARGRVMVNEMFLLVAALLALTRALYTRRVDATFLFLALFGITSVALILTQSRAYWVDLALGLLLLFLFVDIYKKRRFAILGLLGVASFVGVLYLLVGDFLFLLFYGLADRLLSLRGATKADLSLVNRFYEMQALWELIRVNPVLGYGMGVKFTFFDATTYTNWVKTFAHNGYMMLWFKFGLIGLGFILFLWGRSIWVAFRVALRRAASPEGRMYALALGVCLVALIPSHNSSATFSTGDTVLMFGIMTGWIAGLSCRDRSDRLASGREG